MPKHRCTTAGCLTDIPVDHGTLCYFCARIQEEPSKACLRCRHVLPLDNFAWNGTAHLCDNCRWNAPMTPYEANQARYLSRRAFNQRHPRRLKMRDRKRQRAASIGVHFAAEEP